MVKQDCLLMLTLVQIIGCNGEARLSARVCVIPDHWL